MHWFFQRILDRLLLKSTIHAASQFEADLTLQLGESRAELLRKAHELEQERIPGLDEVAASLRAQAARMGQATRLRPATCWRWLRASRDDLREAAPAALAIEHENFEQARGKPLPLPSPGGKKRGRPRKVIEPQSEDGHSDLGLL